MAEGSQAQHHGHILLLAHFKESAQVALSVPAENSLLLFNVIPENVSGHHGNTTQLHFVHFALPFIGRNAAVVYLAHHGHHPLPTHNETL